MTCHAAFRPSVRALLSAVVAGGFLLPPAPVATRAADAELSATWRSADVAIDGSMADWPRLERVETGPAVAAGNDGTALYLAIVSNDITVREQLATGLIVWLDPAARRRQTFGVRLEGLAPRPLAGATPTSAANGLSSDRVQTTLEEFDLLGPARLQRRLIDDTAAVGIALASGVEDGTVVYALKVPLATSAATPHAVGVGPGATISIGLETPADPRPPRRRNELDRPMASNPWIYDPYGYGNYFRPPPPPGGSARPPKAVEFKPMKLVWATLRLAAAPDATAPAP